MPWGAAIGLAVVLTAAGILVIVIGRQAASGRLKRNYLAGIRTTGTLASDEAWSTGHRAAGGRLILAGLGPLILGPLLLVRPSNGVGAVLVFGAIAWLLAWVLAAGATARRAIAAD